MKTTSTPPNATSVPIAEQLAHRWSPRGFDATHHVSDEDLAALGEAARWAPSAGNSQPARFVVARRGTPTFEKIHGALMGFNQSWTPRASLLIVALAETHRDGKPLRWAEYDLGQAVAHLTVEAQNRGLHVRQMGGFKADRMSEAFDLPAELLPVAVVAVGRHDAGEHLPADVRERDAAPRGRRALEALPVVLDV